MRTLTDSFLEPREYIKMEVEGPTDELVFHVTWPRENPPQALELKRVRGQALGRTISLDALTVDAEERKILIERVDNLREGEIITLFWDWEVAPASNDANG